MIRSLIKNTAHLIAKPINLAIFSRYFKLNLIPRQANICSDDFLDQKIMIITPHVDDEIIGAGGFIHHLSLHSCRIKCMYMTDGSKSYHPHLPQDELIAARKGEAIELSRQLDIEEPGFLQVADTQLGTESNHYQQLLTEIKAYNPEILFLPHPLDGHPDHGATVTVTLEALTKAKYPKDTPIYLYGAANSLTPNAVNRCFALQDEIYQKAQLLEIFQTQTMSFAPMLLLDRCRRFAVRSWAPEALGAEFFSVTSMGNLESALKDLDPRAMSINFGRISSTVKLPFQFFRGWSIKKKFDHKLQHSA